MLRPFLRMPERGGGGGSSSSGAPTDATYIVQTANASLANEQALGALATGLLLSTTGTGVVSIAAQGTDYYAPGGTDVAIADGGTGQSTATAAFDALAPTTTTGDLIYHNGTDNIRLALGATFTTPANFLGTFGYKYPQLLSMLPWGGWVAGASTTATSNEGTWNSSTNTDATSTSGSAATCRFFQQDTSTTLDNDASTIPVNASYRIDNHPFVMFRFSIVETTDKRFFIGLTNSATVATTLGADAPACGYLGLQYSTSRPDTNWQIARDGAAGGGSQTLVDTGVAVSTSELCFVIDWTADASVTVYLLNSSFTVLFTATYATDLMASTVSVYPFIGTRTLTTAVKSHKINYAHGVSRLGF